MTEFKICGLRTLPDALAAADAGAALLGFVFVEGVRRQIAVELARDIITEVRRARGDDCPRIVGLFANQPLGEVNGVARACGLDAAQLCGDEPPEYWDGVDAGVIRQVKVDDALPREAAVIGRAARSRAGCGAGAYDAFGQAGSRRTGRHGAYF